MERWQEILEKATILFSDMGYENTTLKDIALAVNTVPAEIYDHFDGKEALLEAIYERYSDIVIAERPTPEDYIPVLQSGTAEDILNIFNYPLPEPLDLNFRIIRIVYSKKLGDERAGRVYQRNAWEVALEYLREVLTKGVEIGRLDMDSDAIDALAHLVHATREYSASMVTAIPDQVTWRRIESNMVRQLASLLVLKEPAAAGMAAEVNVLAALEEAIQCESILVGKYYHYSVLLRLKGETRLAHFIDEIVENVMDELDALHSFVGEGGEAPDSDAIIRSVANSERMKRLQTEKVAARTEGPVSDFFTQIAELAQQHERLCRVNQE